MAFQIESVDWKRGQNRLKQLRLQVFVIECHLPEHAEFDEHDVSAFHVLLSNEDNQPVATGRLTRNGELGRIAVHPAYRNLQVYKSIYAALCDIARQNEVKTVSVVCDLDSVDYHQRLGLRATGPVFMEAGIPRQRMLCPIERDILPDMNHLH